MAADSSAGAFARMDTSLKNFTDQLGVLLAGPLAALADGVANAADGVADLVVKPETTKAVTELTQRLEELQAQRDALAKNQAQTAELPFASGQFFAEGAAEWDKPALDVDTSAAEAKLTSLDAQIRALELLIAGLNESSNTIGQMQADRFMAVFTAGQADLQAAADAATAAITASFASIQTSLSSQIGNLTKSLIPDLGAMGALDLNIELIDQLTTKIQSYQNVGMSAAEASYRLTEWFLNEAEAARNAAGSLNTYARSAGNAATASARSIAPIRAMAGALRDVSMAA